MRTKKNTEIPMVPKAHLKNVEHQRDEYKAELDKLVDELSWYKAKVSRLERENEQLKESHIKHITNMENYYKDRLQKLKEENERKDKLIKALKASESNLWHSSREFEDENEQLKERLNALGIREEPTSMSVADMQTMRDKE